MPKAEGLRLLNGVNATNFHRFRKYERMKHAAHGKKFDRVSILYWRYWFKMYGDHHCLWGKHSSIRFK